MLNKHPQAPSPEVPSGLVPQPPKLAESTVLKCVKSFPPGSAPGPSGLRPSHLFETVLCPSPDLAAKSLFSLSCLVNLLASGHVPLQFSLISVVLALSQFVRRVGVSAPSSLEIPCIASLQNAYPFLSGPPPSPFFSPTSLVST